MTAPVWVLHGTIVALQEQLLAAFGGAAGIRDTGPLESALARRQQLLAYDPGRASVFSLAASYAFGLTKNHPFVDGNKRIAFAAASIFLELNGYHFAATEADVVIQTLALAAGELKEEEYAGWLKKNSSKRGRR
jgi:death on curing protein